MEKKATTLYRLLPQDIKTILLISEGWLVGNSISNILEDFAPKDYDIVVTDVNKFGTVNKAIQLISDGYFLNNYGGFKYKLKSGIFVDIWPEELSHFLMTANRVDYVFNLKKAILLEKENK